MRFQVEWFQPHSQGSATSMIAYSQSLIAPSSIPLAVNELQAVMLRAVLARLRADALPAAGLPVIRTAFCGWTALLPYCGEVF